MNSEKLMRTSMFGGFKKSDVLGYIEELQCNMEEVKRHEEKKAQEAEVLAENVVKLRAELDEVKQENAALTERVAEFDTVCAENADLKAQTQSLTAQVNDFEQTRQALQQKSESLKTTEAQLGAAFLDARRYSDEIVAAANQKADEISSDVSESIKAQADEIARLTADVDAISASFARSIEELHANIEELARKMSAAAKELSLRKPAPKFIPDVQISIEDKKLPVTATEINTPVQEPIPSIFPFKREG